MSRGAASPGDSQHNRRKVASGLRKKIGEVGQGAWPAGVHAAPTRAGKRRLKRVLISPLEDEIVRKCHTKAELTAYFPQIS